MALIINPCAAERIRKIALQLSYLGMNYDRLPAAILYHAMNMTDCLTTGGIDLEIFADPFNETDFSWQRSHTKDGERVIGMVGGINCHERWLGDLMKNKITYAEIYVQLAKLGPNAKELPLQWSFNS